MQKTITLTAFFSIISLVFAYSQNHHRIDSLNSLLTTAYPQDTNKVITLSKLCDEHSTFNPDKALAYGRAGLLLAKQLNFKNGIALCLNKIGAVYFNKGVYKDAIDNYWQALKINEETGNKNAAADNLNNIGAVYRTQGNHEKALKYNLEALKMNENSGSKAAIAACRTNIGNVYFDALNYPKALENYCLALGAFEKMGDKQNTATVLNNIGGIYYSQGDMPKAIGHFKQAINIFETIGDQPGIAMDWNNIGQVYAGQNNYKKAIEYYRKSLALATKVGAKDLIKYSYESLFDVSEKMNNYKAALEYHKLYANIKDTLLNAQINKQIDEMAVKYETDKKEKENALLKKETTEQYFLNQRQRIKLNYLILALIIIAGTGFMFFIRSVSRKKTNKFLKELVDLKTQEENELRKAKNAVEQSMKLKEQFLANISHEIRTPLNAIIGFTDVLQQSNIDFQEKEYISYIKSAGEDLVNIVNDLLDMSKIEAGMIAFEEKPINVFELFKSLEALLSQKAKEKQLTLSFYCSGSIPKLVTGDPTRLTQILVNLIGNAIKFTEKGKIEIKARLLKEDRESIALEFSVKDTGIGISKEKLDHIFERFIQAEADTTRKYGGTGLGLSIVKHLVELQNGTIAVVSELGEGSEFTFSIMFKPPGKIHPKTKKFLEEQRHLKGLKILLVEDNILNTRLVLAIFSNSGIQIDVTENGKEAIAQLEKKSYDLILMDMQMPVMDGYQTTTYIRKELKSNIPIIAITAHAMTGEKEKCLQLGMNDYIPKPVSIDILFEKINNLAIKATSNT